MKAEAEAAEERPHDPDNDVPKEAEAAALRDDPGQPARNGADDEEDEEFGSGLMGVRGS